MHLDLLPHYLVEVESGLYRIYTVDRDGIARDERGDPIVLNLGVPYTIKTVLRLHEVEKLPASEHEIRTAIQNRCHGSIPLLLHCPVCNARHIDEGEFATRHHHTHACQECGHTWRPALVNTVGVRFIPGFKNGHP